MADVLKFKLADVPDDLNEASAKGYVSAGIREGTKREKARSEAKAKETATQHAGEIKGIKQAHEAELVRVGHLHGRAKFWQGGLVVGAIVGSIVAVAAAWYTDSVIQSAFDAASTMRARADITESVMRERDREQP